MITRGSLAFTLVLGCMLVSACSVRVDVLQGDAGPTVPDPAADGGNPDLGCGMCGTLELCAIDRCVDAAGTTTLSSGLRHTCAITNGKLACWGDNGSAQLGVGDNQDRTRPAPVGDFEDWLMVAGGQQHGCAIRSPGTLYCWGENTVGQLALGGTDARSKPARVPGFSDFARVAAGGDNTCALRASGALYCWGDNLEGNPGQGDAPGAADLLVPRRVAPTSEFRSVSVGAGHSCAISKDGALYCWGRNTDGQLGTGDQQSRREPTRIGRGHDWRVIAAGQHHTCGIRDEGELYCWGRNEFFELGIGSGALDDATLFPEPVRVGRDDDWSDVALGGFHTCALKRSGALLCFGRAAEGQLGLGGAATPVAVPTQVDAALRFRSVTLGSFHTCALDAERVVRCWGANTEGQLGVGDTAARDVPTPID